MSQTPETDVRRDGHQEGGNHSQVEIGWGFYKELHAYRDRPPRGAFGVVVAMGALFVLAYLVWKLPDLVTVGQLVTAVVLAILIGGFAIVYGVKKRAETSPESTEEAIELGDESGGS